MGERAPFNLFVSSTHRDLKESQRGYTNLVTKKDVRSIEIVPLIQRAF
jgi:hypothetical protein